MFSVQNLINYLNARKDEEFRGLLDFYDPSENMDKDILMFNLNQLQYGKFYPKHSINNKCETEVPNIIFEAITLFKNINKRVPKIIAKISLQSDDLCDNFLDFLPDESYFVFFEDGKINYKLDIIDKLYLNYGSRFNIITGIISHSLLTISSITNNTFDIIFCSEDITYAQLVNLQNISHADTLLIIYNSNSTIQNLYQTDFFTILFKNEIYSFVKFNLDSTIQLNSITEFNQIQEFVNYVDTNSMEYYQTIFNRYYNMYNMYPKRIVEIGFNEVSSSNLLNLLDKYNSNNYMLVSFDEGKYKYSKEQIDNKYPGKHILITGNSVNTIPSFSLISDITFDIIIINGNHTFVDAYSDIINCAQISNLNTISIIDNVIPHRDESIEVYLSVLCAINKNIIQNLNYDTGKCMYIYKSANTSSNNLDYNFIEDKVVNYLISKIISITNSLEELDEINKLDILYNNKNNQDRYNDKRKILTSRHGKVRNNKMLNMLLTSYDDANNETLLLLNEAWNNPISAVLTTDDIKYKLGYIHKINNKRFRPIIHKGQRKLFMNELQFLNTYVKLEDKNNYVIYAGGSPGDHLYELSRYYPNVKFIVIDPSRNQTFISDNLKIINNERCSYRRQYYYDVDNQYVYKMKKIEDIKKLILSSIRIFVLEDLATSELLLELKSYLPDDSNIYLWSDIRTCCSKSGLLGKNIIDIIEDRATDGDIMWNLTMQYNWLRTIYPKASMLKFRPPYYDNDVKNIEEFMTKYNKDFDFSPELNILENYKRKHILYPKGKIYIQPWQPMSSTETRIVIEKDDINTLVTYDAVEHDDICNYYNLIERPVRSHNVGIEYYQYGHCECNDCAIDIDTFNKYLNKPNHIQYIIKEFNIPHSYSKSKIIGNLSLRLQCLLNSKLEGDNNHGINRYI